MNSSDDTLKTWNQLADRYADAFFDLDLYNDTYDRFCELVQKPNALIFELACGPGNITNYLITKRPDFKIMATDTSENMLTVARQKVAGVSFSVLDSRNLNSISEKPDAFVFGFGLPYVDKNACEKLISDVATKLQPGGIFYLSTIEGAYNQSGFELDSSGENGMNVYYYDATFLENQFQKNGLKTESLFRKNYVNAAGKKIGASDSDRKKIIGSNRREKPSKQFTYKTLPPYLPKLLNGGLR